MMLVYGVVTISILISSVNCIPFLRDGEYIVPNDTAQCANDLIDWCKGMQYPKKGAGISMTSVTISEPTGILRFFCESDSEGTNCTKNGSPWIACSNDNQFSYKAKPMTKDSSEGNDEGMCKTANIAFNNLGVENLSVDNTTLNDELQKGMMMMFKQIEIMREKIGHMADFLSNMFSPGNPRNMFDPFHPSSFDTESPPRKNQIEREERK